MSLQISDKNSRADEKVSVLAMDVTEQERRIQTEIARRAYKIFKSRGGSPGYELEDWRRAEADVICRGCHARMVVDAGLWIGTNADLFEEGSIEIWISPWRITICGRQPANQKIAAKRSTRPGATIFQVIDLGCLVDPNKVKTKIDGSSLEILMRSVQRPPQVQAKSIVAAA
jgi:hypothetical protein